MFTNTQSQPAVWSPANTITSDFATHCQDAVDAIKRLMVAVEVTTISASYGKDSSVVLALALEAARQLLQIGKRITLRIITSDTQVENPSQTRLAVKMSARAIAFAQEQGLDVEQIWVTPSPLDHYLVAMLGGRSVASVPGGDAACSVNLKVRPLEKVRKRLIKEYGAGKVGNLIGTRFDESTTRATNMTSRGESATRAILQSTGAWLLSPIAHWTEGDVWRFLNGSARQVGFDTLDHTPVLAHYETMQEATCNVLSLAEAGPKSKSPCKGGRGGCFVCQKVADDHSMTHMLGSFPHYEPLARLSRVIRAGHWVPENRSFLSKTADDQNRIRIFSNAYSPEWTANLLKWVMSIDANEDDYARARSARTGRKVERRFPRLLTEEHEILIMFLWSRYGVQTPGRFIRIREAIAQGKRWALPSDDEIEVMAAKGNRKLMGKTLGYLHSDIPVQAPTAYRDSWRDMIDIDSACATDLMRTASGERAMYRSGTGSVHDSIEEADAIECNLDSVREADGSLGMAYEDMLWWMEIEFADGNRSHNDEMNFLIRQGLIRARKGYQSTLAGYQHYNLVLRNLNGQGPIDTLESILEHPAFATPVQPTWVPEQHKQQLEMFSA